MSDTDIQARLAHLRNTGFVAREVLDVGAYKGTFASIVRRVFPEARLHLFEANEAHSRDLENAAHALGNCEVNIGLLGSEAVSLFRLQDKNGPLKVQAALGLPEQRTLSKRRRTSVCTTMASSALMATQ